MSNDNDARPFDERVIELKSFSVPPEPGSTGPSAPCPDCYGSGRIVLLTSSRLCRRCGGAGQVDAAGGKPEPTAQDQDEVNYTYDLHGRVTSVRHPRGNVQTVWEFEG
jgi:YD repeat-containing protein